MNILPLVIFSLLILSFAASSFFRERQSTYWEERCYSGYMNAERKLRNQVSSALYAKIRKKEEPQAANSKAAPPAPEQEGIGSYVNRRERGHLTELSKLNITPLFLQNSSDLREIAARMIRELYKDAPFFADAKIAKLEYVLIDTLIETGRANKSSTHFKDLFPEDPVLRRIYYKMAKGTHGSYPPLGEFLALDRNAERRPVNFSFASIPLLKALFGEAATKNILDEEHQKWLKDGDQHRLAEEELTEILNTSERKPFDYHKIKDFLDFSRKAAPKKNLTGYDKTTKIIVTKEL